MVNDIAVQDFVNAIKEEPQDTNRTYNATVSHIDNEGVVWVYLQGSSKETPTASTSTEVKKGDAVTVQWRNNKLYIGGNYSNPSAGVGTVMPSVDFVAELIDKDITVNSINAATGYIGELTSKKITAEDITADHATIKELDVESMAAATAYIRDLTAENVTADDIIADHATIDDLDVTYAEIDAANVTDLSAQNAWVNKIMVQTGLIAHEGAVFTLDAIQVNAANITAGTLDVNRLIVTVDGQKYLVNVDPTTGTPSYEKMDGNIVEPRTITADKIVAHDITVQEITTENLVGTNGWINLNQGKFFYTTNGSTWANTTNGIMWDGTSLKIKGDVNITAGNVYTKTESDTALSGKVGNNEVITKINASSEGVQIQAAKVNIAGATIFTEGRLSETSLDNAYDAKGSASAAQSAAEANAQSYTDTATADMATNTGIANTYATKAAANAQEQTIYKSAVAGTSSMSGTTTWITSVSDTQNAWTTKRPTYSSSYPVLFVATQRKSVSNAVTCTTPVKDDTTTVIDGGHITTGTIDASQVTVTNIDASKITVNKIQASQINTDSITVGDLSDGSNYSTTSQMNTAIGDAVDGIDVGGRNLLKVNGSSTSKNTYRFADIPLTEPLVAGEEYTLQLWGISLDANSTGIGAYWGSGNNNLCTFARQNGHLTNTFTVTSAQASHADASNLTIYLYSYPSGRSDYNTSITKWKLEKGNKATDWSQAPEDIVNDNLLIDSQKMGAWQIGTNASLDSSSEFGVATITGNTSWTGIIYSKPTISASILDGSPLWLSFEYQYSESTAIAISLTGTSAAVDSTTSITRTKYLTKWPVLESKTAWTKYSIQMPSTVAELTSGSGDVNSLYVQFYNYYTANSTLKIRKVKLEHGIASSDWTPSPQDQKAYITRIDDAGIRIHPADTIDNSVVINASGMEVFKGGTASANSVAFYGDTARIGKALGQRVVTTGSGVSLYDSNNVEMATINTAGARIGKASGGSKVTATTGGVYIYDQAGVDKFGIVENNMRIGAGAEPHIRVNPTSGMTIWKGAETNAANNVANYSDTVRIGREDSYRTLISSGGVQLVDGTGTNAFSLLASDDTISRLNTTRYTVPKKYTGDLYFNADIEHYTISFKVTSKDGQTTYGNEETVTNSSLPVDYYVTVGSSTNNVTVVRTGKNTFRADNMSESAYRYLNVSWTTTAQQQAKILYTGANTTLVNNVVQYMQASQTVYLSEPVSSQLNGIVLAWSAYASSAAQNYHWNYTFVPKNHVLLFNGNGVSTGLLTSSPSLDFVGNKYVYVYDDRIVGCDGNQSTGTKNGITYANNHWVLRYVYGV